MATETSSPLVRGAGATDSNVRHESIDWSQREPVTAAVVRAVAALEGVRPTELDPIREYVNPDALDALFERGDVGHVEFRFGDYGVTVRGDGEVLVRPGE